MPTSFQPHAHRSDTQVTGEEVAKTTALRTSPWPWPRQRSESSESQKKLQKSENIWGNEMLAAANNIEDKIKYNRNFGSAVVPFRFDGDGRAHIPFCAGAQTFGKIFHRFGFQERHTSRANGFRRYLSSKEECTPLQLKVLKAAANAAANRGYPGWNQSDFPLTPTEAAHAELAQISQQRSSPTRMNSGGQLDHPWAPLHATAISVSATTTTSGYPKGYPLRFSSKGQVSDRETLHRAPDGAARMHCEKIQHVDSQQTGSYTGALTSISRQLPVSTTTPDLALSSKAESSQPTAPALEPRPVVSPKKSDNPVPLDDKIRPGARVKIESGTGTLRGASRLERDSYEEGVGWMVDMDDGTSIGVAHSDFEVIPSAPDRSAASKKQQRLRTDLHQRQKRNQKKISDAEERGAKRGRQEMEHQFFDFIKDQQQRQRMSRRKMRHDAQQLRRKLVAEAKEEGRKLKLEVQARDRAKRIKLRHLTSADNKPLRKDEHIRVRAAQALREANQKMIESEVSKARRKATASVGRNIQRRGMRQANRPGGLGTADGAAIPRRKPEKGRVKVWKDQGYGFIYGNVDLFFHITNVIEGAEYLRDEADVSCLDAEYVPSYDKKKDKWQAQMVKVTLRSELAVSCPSQTR